MAQNGSGTAIRANAVRIKHAPCPGSFTSSNGPAMNAVTANAGKYGAYAANDAVSTQERGR